MGQHWFKTLICWYVTEPKGLKPLTRLSPLWAILLECLIHCMISSHVLLEVIVTQFTQDQDQWCALLPSVTDHCDVSYNGRGSFLAVLWRCSCPVHPGPAVPCRGRKLLLSFTGWEWYSLVKCVGLMWQEVVLQSDTPDRLIHMWYTWYKQRCIIGMGRLIAVHGIRGFKAHGSVHRRQFAYRGFFRFW